VARYTLRRLLQVVPVGFGVILISFVLIQLAPGDPASVLAGEYADAKFVEGLRAELGLDRPLAIQFLRYLGRVVGGDLGYSFFHRQPVWSLIWSRIPSTLLLMLTSFVVATGVGVVAGIASSRRPRGSFDTGALVLSLTGYSLPEFWTGQLLLIAFAVMFPLFPAQGMQSFVQVDTGWGRAWDVVRHLTLPAFALGFRYLGITLRLTRTSMMEVNEQDYVRTARAKGVSETTVQYRHVLRNALLPVITLIGTNLSFLVMGSVLVETVFAWPGIGRLVYDAIFNRDYPVILGTFLVMSVVVVLVHVVTDLICAAIDPRVRLT
jgi:ABC-type dipeptide/oligopeptide/nickel transport system permease component